AVAVGDRRAVGAVQPTPGVVAHKLRAFRQPAHLPVGDDPRRMAGDLPQTAQSAGLADETADIMEGLKRPERRSRVQSIAAPGEAERGALARREYAGQARAQTGAHALALAQHGLVDAGAERRYACQARLAGESNAHRQTYRTINPRLGLAAEEVDDEGAHVVACDAARARPGVGDLYRA